MKVIHKNLQPYSLSEVLLCRCARRLQSKSAELLQRRGGKMIVYANDYIGNAINAEGFYEWGDLQAVFDFLNPLKTEIAHSLALDVGANVGNHSIYFSHHFKGVHAFEPHPLTYRILEANASLYSGIKTHNFALSDRSGQAHLLENPTNLGRSSISSPSSSSVVISLERLDDVDIDRNRISLIKLDVEGHEANVLRGGVNTLRYSMPIVLFEAHTADFDNPMEEVEILNALGYRFAWLQPPDKGIRRYVNLLVKLVCGHRVRAICTGESILPANHSMIIAVPPRWQALLGLH